MADKLSSVSSGNFSKGLETLKELQEFWCACERDLAERLESRDSESKYEEYEEVEVKKKSLWQTILQESEERDAPYIAWLNERKKTESEDPNSSAVYLDREVFPILLPAMEKMLREARRWNALAVQKCRFSGLDYLAEYLWNKNPRWPRRSVAWLEAFDIPQFKLCMRLNPRPIFPLSWLWSDEEGALHIQRWVRGWLVRKREDVQEMRQFWKTIAADKGTLDKDPSNTPPDSPVLDTCQSYRLLAKKRERPF